MSPVFIGPLLIVSALRLGIWMILNASEGLGFPCLFATVCSTWVSINVGTSRRSRVLPEGDWRKPSVRWSNCMVSRTLGIHIYFFERIDGSICNSYIGVFASNGKDDLRDEFCCFVVSLAFFSAD